MALWRTENKDELNLIAKEFAGEVDNETFHRDYEYIMRDAEDRHVFRFSNLHKKDIHTKGNTKTYTAFGVM